ncbi:MAG: CHASE2 domain-containing protein [Desulfobacterales bacterium]|uniref:CHASE2 domain-containing protein n=1 Tax=Candidatus Desulfaltia bathyphila TaxID=2841697 RepID=A0A8J6N7T9_9BACT|nr:CHASE2 domain-containing protein [Candidatus Desulfaltia bathyphila]MBL7196109.1 CHASE2 domain-containing protein [Desulfobacterales bacterium]MBL7207378.1 CHASE2 domain-containing protein [Desulfobacterales bacterium]
MLESRHSTYKKYSIIFSLAVVGFSVLFISILFKGIAYNILTQIDNTLYSQFLLIRERLNENKKAVQSNVVIVGIDDRTLNRLGAYNPSRYRRYHIDLLANILKGKPAAVAYDIFFGDPHDDPDVDRRFSEIMKKGPVFSVVFGSAHDRSKQMFKPLADNISGKQDMKFVSENGFESMAPFVLSSLKGIGLANAYPDNDGILRKMPILFKLRDRLYPTISLEVFRSINNIPRSKIRIKNNRVITGKTAIPVDKHCRAFVNIDNTYKIREISFYDVWAGRVPGRFFNDKVVFIAATATGLGDNKLVPLFGYVSGIMIHANLFLNMAYNNFINEIAGTSYYLLIFFASFFYTYLFYCRHELPLIKRAVSYISSVALVTKFGNAFLKIPIIKGSYNSFKSMRDRSYGLRIFFLLFSETRQRLAPVLLQLVFLYAALFLIFYYFNILIKPFTIMIQLVISYIIVSEFKRIDFSKIAPQKQKEKSDRITG